MNTDILPSVVAETDFYAVVYKPPFMHTVPLLHQNPCVKTLLDWYAALFPAIKKIKGRRKEEYGAFHRLDYETNGLVLFAKTQAALDDFLFQQEQGLFVKTYLAESAGFSPPIQGFPSYPYRKNISPLVIESAFRPFGQGRKSVRPTLMPFPKDKDVALDNGSYYRTEIEENKEGKFRIQIRRGFRHQIRCHLAWMGFPLLNDALYGGSRSADGVLALRAVSFVFYDPVSHIPLHFVFF